MGGGGACRTSSEGKTRAADEGAGQEVVLERTVWPELVSHRMCEREISG